MKKISNEKKIIIAIAVYAAVMTMIFHTLNDGSDGKYTVKGFHVFQTIDY